RQAIAKTTAVALGRLDQQAGTKRPKDKGRKSLNSHARCLKVLDTRRQNDFELALSLATNHPELFEVAHEYEFGDFQQAIQHASRPGKTGIVLLRSPA
ncbi:MAG TPA: hypothetical protein VIY49_23565, partial [Bryobacteraceae bacterium]